MTNIPATVTPYHNIGMAFAYYAAKDTTKKVNITIYDPQSGPGQGGGASSAPVTLLHPFTPKGKLIWKGLEGFEAVIDILKKQITVVKAMICGYVGHILMKNVFMNIRVVLVCILM
jgi:hypothetical protein